MSTISGVSGTGDAWSAMKAQRSQMQTKMFAKIDTDSSGGIDKTELSAMLSKVSEKAGVTVGGDTDATFTQMDSNTDGQLSSEELAKGMQSLLPPPSTMEFAQSRSADQDDSLSQTEFEAGRPTTETDATGGTAGVGGPPPPPPPPGGAGGPGGAGKSETATDTSYDSLDTNQDGTVSAMERLVGALEDAVQTASSSSGDSSTSIDIAKIAAMVYDEISAGFASQSSSTLDAVA